MASPQIILTPHHHHHHHHPFTPFYLNSLHPPSANSSFLLFDDWRLQSQPLPFEFVCSRNVEIIKTGNIIVPPCVFSCQSLVTLDLDTLMYCNFPVENDDGTTIGLPNIKTLRLNLGLDYFRQLEKLFSCCPLLEDLSFSFHLLYYRDVVKIFAPNLKLLKLWVLEPFEQNKIIIDAPKLVDVKIEDGSSLYCFAKLPPTQLVSAYVDFTYGQESRERERMGANVYLCEIANFVQGLSSVTNLQLRSNMGLFTYFESVVDSAMPTFRNLSCFKTMFNGNNGGKDFILSLQCTPNLAPLLQRL